ncbi:MAG: CcmD family protein [Holophagales bacterium]|nr:CcmD family protein [Holophagales bacterium]
MNQDGSIWLAATNLIIWTGLFAYLWSLDRKISRREDEEID